MLIKYLDKCGDCENVVSVAQDCLHKGGHAQTNGPGGVAFEPNHLVGAVGSIIFFLFWINREYGVFVPLDDFLVQLGPVFRVVLGADVGVDLSQAHARNIDSGPHGNLK